MPVVIIENSDMPPMPATMLIGMKTMDSLVSFDTRWKLEDNDHTARYGGGAELFLRNSNGQTGFPLRIGGLSVSVVLTVFIVPAW